MVISCMPELEYGMLERSQVRCNTWAEKPTDVRMELMVYLVDEDVSLETAKLYRRSVKGHSSNKPR